jgi:hypothetical protein
VNKQKETALLLEQKKNAGNKQAIGSGIIKKRS